MDIYAANLNDRLTGRSSGDTVEIGITTECNTGAMPSRLECNRQVNHEIWRTGTTNSRRSSVYLKASITS
jgi:hypothetical protein